ncbi:MAG: UdgX family uracil-DNA binding protein [Methylibium sp.]|nr:UdgX family uracil-DNA binding protein [Methylibium sp.]
MIAVRALAQAVRRDLHKMKAFVRFRELRSESPAAAAAISASLPAPARDAAAAESTASSRTVPAATLEGEAGPADAADAPSTTISHIAWFEPEHHIVEAVAPFFASRFATLRWAILTPVHSVRWDGERLAFGPGARREDAPPADAGERLWLTYYEHIFNPARLKLAAMQKEMPRRYWPNLPEARLIEPLASRSAVRSEAMVAREAALPRRRLPQTSVQPRGPVTSADAGDGADASKAAKAADTDNPRGAGNANGTADGAAGAGRALAALRTATDRCRECPIGEHATQSVTGEGPPGARLMLVGEQPGDQEDLRGRPFVGPAGQLLDRALTDLSWPRDALYVTNAVKHFKFELRGTRRIHKTPGQREAAACLHWLESEIEQVQPQAFVALGATAARSLMGRAVGVTSERGRWLLREDGRRVLITLHPSALLRLQAGERQAAYALWLTDLAHATELLQGGG